MGRSQRHRIYIQGSDVAGKGLSEKNPAIVYIRQNAASQSLTVPLGIAGGPLKGSSLAGYPPTTFPAPGLLAERDGEITQPPGDFTEPGQFNLSGNPRFTDLPPAGEGSTEPPPPLRLAPPVQSKPAGPILILRIERTPVGVAVTVDGDVRVATGDMVTIEASGNTGVNGTYEVLSVDGRTIELDGTPDLAGPIEGKGRLINLGAG